MHPPDALRQLGFSACRAGMLSQMLCPRTDPHFCPEGTWTLQYFIDTEEKSTIAQKDEPELFYQSKEPFPVFGTNDQLGCDCDGPVIGLGCQRKLVCSLQRNWIQAETVSEVNRKWNG